MSDPSLLITRPTAGDPTLAPPGKHLHYVLAPCPNTDIGPSARSWDELAPRYRDSLLTELERRGLAGLGASIEEECLVTPVDWTAQGHAHAAPRSRPPTPSRRPAPSGPATSSGAPPTPSSCGCGTTPGVGVPTVLISGKLAAARITGPRRPRTASANRPVPKGHLA